MRIKLESWLVVLVMLSVACGERTEIKPVSDVAFAPLKKGKFWIYQVDSIAIAGNIEHRFQYQLQVEITDSITEGTGQIWYVLTRSKRVGAGVGFSALVPWSARRNSQQLLVRAGNTIFEPLSFPVIAGRVWNGNAFNTLGGDEFCESAGACDQYKYVAVGGTRIVGSATFADVLTVEEGNTPDRLVKFDLRTSHYARNVGLIEREYRVLNYCTLPACFGRQFIDQGLVYTQTLVEYGDR